ncbi:hypothetical protein CBR_g81554 [Chara braunii]|uniref:RNA-directed DNA polymerase n=1 Tax=Chara braunii TaxID=69332 RepID=A0A388KAQ6_CHABU|nr:hypothetical protein CBR_g81554 [Chara braunii]|eukprot:GBG67130.1 hypothetical protein CBR_g81554 [Chara braunii]
MTAHVKGTYVSVVENGLVGGYSKRVLWREKRQDHMLVVFDNDMIEKLPLDEVKGGVMSLSWWPIRVAPVRGVLLTMFVRCLPTDIKNLLANEAQLEYHTFETFSKKALGLEATLGGAQQFPTDGKKKSPQEWKKGSRLMMGEVDGTQTEIDDFSDFVDSSELDNEDSAEGSDLAALVKIKAGGRGKGGQQRSQWQTQNPNKIAAWVRAGLDQDVWRDQYMQGACINFDEYGHQQCKCKNAKVSQKIPLKELGKMATEKETDNRKSEGGPGLGGSAVQSEEGQKDRESINPDGTKGNRKEISSGESSGKAGGSRQGTQETKEGRNKDRTSSRNSKGAVSKKVRVTDARRKLTEIEKRTAEYKARLIEEMMTGNEEGPLQEEPRDERKANRGGTRQGDKGSDRGGTSSKRRKEKDNSPGMEAEKATTPPAIDSRASRLPTTPAVTRGCEGLWSLRESVLGWFDLEGTTKTREGQKAGKEGPDNSMAGEASSSEGGLRKIVSSLARALNKNQGYLADAKKKLTFDGANITEFLIDYENLVALLKWTEEEKMDHLGQHVSLSLGWDIMAIVAASRSWKETQDVMMRKYLAAEKMATEADLAAVQRKNFANNDFLREFTLVALRIPGVTDRIMSKYFLKQFSEFDKDKILSAYQQMSKFVNTRDVDFTTVTDLAEKTVVTETLDLLKEEGEREEEAPQEVANLQRSRWDLEDLEKAFADIRLSLPDREGGEVMRSPPGTKLSFHALPVGKLKIQIGTHHTDALVDGGAEITLIRRDFATITGCTVNKEVTGSIRGAGGEIPFAGYVKKCAVKAGVRESIWSFQRMTVTEEMDHDIILERPWCVNVEMIGMHLHDGSYMVDIEDPVTGRGELLRLLGTGGDPPKGKLATWSPSFEDSTRKGAFARMEGMRERVEIMIEEAFKKKEWIKMGLPQKKRRQEDEVLGVMVAEKESEVERGSSLPSGKKKPDPAKTNKISQWPTPLRTTMEVRAFLGVVGFWRIFIKNFAKIAEPIRAMIREEGTMDWTEEREGVVQKLKDILTFETIALSARCFNDKVGRPFILETDGGPLAVGGVLIQRDEGGKERRIRFESRTLNSAERRYSQFKKEVLAILHYLKTFQFYLFGRRFILRIDATNVVGALKNYRPIDPTVGRWVGFIGQFDYKIERNAGIRNKADGLSRVCITPEGVEGAEPIDAFLEYEGGTLAVDNEMMSEECTSGELLIQTLEKGAYAVVAELREGRVTTRGRREEKDSWGAIVGPKEELIAMAVEGGREAVMSLVESWERRELQWVVNQMQERKDGGQEGEKFFYVQLYEGFFREIGLLLVGNKQPTEVSIKARQEAERYVLRGGHLFRREEGAMPRTIVCGRSRQVDVIQTMHDGLVVGHRSSKGTFAKITPLYYWPGMAGMVAIYCQTCLICQERSSARVFEPLRPTRVLGPGHLVHLDLGVMPVSTDGYRYILDGRDNLSGFVEAVALKKKTGRSVADWIEDFYLRHPFVRRFIADNETEFVNQEVLGMLKRLCVPIKLIEPYHPEANGPVEKGHQTLKNTIAKLAADRLGNWPRYLKQVVFAENDP